MALAEDGSAECRPTTVARNPSRLCSDGWGRRRLSSFVAGWALRAGTATAFSRIGADLVVVPRGTLVNITSSLLTVQPTDETLAVDLAKSLRAIAGVARVAPQRIVPVVVDGKPANVIAFDPAQDFTVLSWLEDRHPVPTSRTDLIVSHRLPGQPLQKPQPLR